MKDNSLKEFLNTNYILYKNNHNIKYETYFKMGGIVNFFIIPSNQMQLVKLLDYLHSQKLNFKIIGFSSNILLFDELEYTILISTKLLTDVKISKENIEVSAGYSLEELVRLALLKKSKGYEGLEGIPGSIGGAIVMNAGAYGYTISDNLESLTYYHPKNGIQTALKEECKFNHRDSIFKTSPEYIILSAKFNLIKSNQKDIANKITQYHIARHSYQEFAYPSLGSLFSLKDDFYRLFLKKNKFYYFILIILKIIFKNKFIKLINRKNPKNTIFNNLIKNYLNPVEIPYNFSSKSMNILINDGSDNIENIFTYISLIKNNIKEGSPLENEIIIEPTLESVKKLEIKKLLKEKGLI